MPRNSPQPLAFRESGIGRPVVYLHGGGPGCSGWTDFRQVVEVLGGGYRHLLVDFAGYGDSESGPIQGRTLDAHAADLRSLLDTLGLDRVDVVAQSLGGSVALNLAALEPDRVGRLVVTGSQPVPHAISTTELGLQARSRYYGGDGPTLVKMRALLAELEWYDGDSIPGETVQLRYDHSVTPWAMATADGSGRGTPQDLSDRLDQVAAPTLWLWGAHDPFAPPEYALAVSATMPYADVAVLARTAHHPQEERPADYAATAAAFLRLAP